VLNQKNFKYTKVKSFEVGKLYVTRPRAKFDDPGLHLCIYKDANYCKLYGLFDSLTFTEELPYIQYYYLVDA